MSETPVNPETSALDRDDVLLAAALALESEAPYGQVTKLAVADSPGEIGPTASRCVSDGSSGEIDLRTSLLSDKPDVSFRPRPSADSIPGYEIIREIYRGGQGVVYEAVQLAANRTVAVKVMHESAFASERARARFEREVRLIARLRHPNIVVLHDSGVTQGRYFFAMDLVRGLPLDKHVRSSGLPVGDTVRLFLKACDAVSYAHRRGVIHRDLKPSNILVSENNEPQVLDFGLAKIVGDELEESGDVQITETGQLLGTLRYMSPEQTRRNPDEIDTRTDVYALGLILYELLVGELPYRTNTDLAETIATIREADPPRPSRLRREIRSDLDAVALKALAKEPDRRYQSAGELADDLRAWLDGRPVTAKSDSAFYVFRKLAARHYFHTSVIAALIALIIAFGSISYQAYLRVDSALQDKTVSEKSLRDALDNMSEFKSQASERIRRQMLGWFLFEWQAGHLEQARTIQAHMADKSSGEYLAMSFLLDESIPLDELLRRLPPGYRSLAHFVTGERLLKMGRNQEAAAEFAAVVQGSQTRDDVVWLSAAARLDRLRQLGTRPAEGASPRPAEGAGAR